jgi:hypothetical protein
MESPWGDMSRGEAADGRTEDEAEGM